MQHFRGTEGLPGLGLGRKASGCSLESHHILPPWSMGAADELQGRLHEKRAVADGTAKPQA